MIEIVSLARCTACNICVRVCPANVFEIVPDALTVIVPAGLRTPLFRDAT